MEKIKKKINKSKRLFFKKINTIYRPLCRLTKKRGRKGKRKGGREGAIIRIRDVRKDSAANFSEIKSIVKKYYEQL